MMRISAIIPAHDAAPFLAEAIASVLAQSLPVAEVVVVDDGSSDGTAQIAAGFGEIVQLERQEKLGPAAARNRGIAMASGDVLAFLDADDIWLPGKLSVQIAALGSADMAFTRIEKFHADDCPQELRGNDGEVQDGYLPSTFACHASVFASIGTFDAGLPGGEFVDWLARARAAKMREILLPEVLARRRIHASNMTRSAASKRAYLDVIRRNLARARQGNGN